MFSFALEKKQNKWEKLPGLRTLLIEYQGGVGGVVTRPVHSAAAATNENCCLLKKSWDIGKQCRLSVDNRMETRMNQILNKTYFPVPLTTSFVSGFKYESLDFVG